jgi:chromosome segregation ATPase
VAPSALVGATFIPTLSSPVDYLKPGLREIGRQAARLLVRARLGAARRRRAKALTQLGLLGWQGADFDPETQRQVDEIQNVEREQSRHLNEAAAHSMEVRRLNEEREAARRSYQEARKELEAELRKANERKAGLEKVVADKRKVEPKFQQRIPELDRELRETNKLYSELLVLEKQTPQTKQEIIRLRERIVAIPNEKNDLRTSHLRSVTELRTFEENLARQVEFVAAVQQRVNYAESQWEAADAALAVKIKAEEKEKNAAERQFASLEAAKSNPYQRIGEVLSGSGLGPINQPEILEEVRVVDVEVALLEGQLLDSQAATGNENPAELRVSLWLWGGVAALVLIVLIAIIF